MKIAIATLGSRGDVQPFVALGVGLQKAGHEVSICTSYSFKGSIVNYGLRYAYMNDEFVKFMATDAGREAIAIASNPIAWMKKAMELSAKLALSQRQMLSEQWAEMQEAEAIVYHPKAIGGYHIAEKLGVPGYLCLPFPCYVPTAAFANPIFPDWKLGGWYNKLTYKIVPWMSFTYRDLVNSWRSESLQLPPTRYPVGNLVKTNGKPVPVMHCYSPLVVPRPDDWGEGAIATGYWFLEPPADWQPPEELIEFLAGGEAPVYVGFGSMAGRDTQKSTKLVLEALAKCGQRGIIAKGWGGLEAYELPKNIIQVEAVPHSWLFPQVAAVVHHGGAGTTAAGLRAGKPTVICPFFGDQPFWGKRIYELKVGAKPIRQKVLTADKLAAAINEVVSDELMGKRARALGEKIQAEDGVGRAVDFIERQSRS